MTLRTTRYSSLISVDILNRQSCLVIGCGAIGYTVARQLAQMGVLNLTLFDPDVIDEVNLGPQGFPAQAIGEFKSEHTADACMALNPECDINDYQTKFSFDALAELEQMGHRWHAAFLCVDSIEDRARIAPKLWTDFGIPVYDARMAAFSARLVSITQDDDVDYYRESLPDPSKTIPEPCTGRSTNWTATLAACLLIRNYAQQSLLVKPLPFPRDEIINLPSPYEFQMTLSMRDIPDDSLDPIVPTDTDASPVLA